MTNEDNTPIASLLINNAVVIKRAIRYMISGLFVTSLHVFIAIMCIHYIYPSTAFANGVAFIIATIFSYLINTIWSFSNTIHRRTLFRFITVSITGFWIAMLISKTTDILGYNHFIGIGAVAVTLPIFTFLLHNFWTYK